MLSKSDCAKYPFTKRAAELVKSLEIEPKDLASSDFSEVVGRAEERIREAIELRMVGYRLENVNVEILSFPVALMLVAAIGSNYVTRRYALAESRRIYELMKFENGGKIAAIAEDLGWDIEPADHPFYDLTLRLSSYLRNMALLHEDRWKLVNRVVKNGRVYLTRVEIARLLSEEIREYLIRRITEHEGIRLPRELENVVERIRRLAMGYEAETTMEELPEIVVDAFSPCMQRLYGLMLSGGHLSHIERFALVSFLLNVGMKVDEIVRLFVSLSDFDDRLTRYQVEHIAGKRGSGTRYSPPNCKTLITHNICPGRDEICGRVKHPIQYYLTKRRARKGGA
ncbi:MAG: hypothetical protein ACE5OY_05665 [Candidatus Bathyarchaeia archaeon]